MPGDLKSGTAKKEKKGSNAIHDQHGERQCLPVCIDVRTSSSCRDTRARHNSNALHLAGFNMVGDGFEGARFQCLGGCRFPRTEAEGIEAKERHIGSPLSGFEQARSDANP